MDEITRLLSSLKIDEAELIQRGLRRYSEARELQLVDVNDEGQWLYLVPEAADAWRVMRAAAKQQGIILFLESAFRSVQRQAELVQYMLEDGTPLHLILCECAAPGYSEHHSGRAVDINTAECWNNPELNNEFAKTQAFAWLQQHAHSFGFVLSYPRDNKSGYAYEPWHWCFQAGIAGGG